MRMIWTVAACGALAGCVADGPAASQSPDIHAQSVAGNYAAAIGAQLRTAADLAAEAQVTPRPAPVPMPPGRVACVSPGYSVPTTGC